MRIFSAKTLLEVLTGITINLTSVWFAVIFIAPGIFGVSSFGEYSALLTQNLPFGIMGIITSALLAEKAKIL